MPRLLSLMLVCAVTAVLLQADVQPASAQCATTVRTGHWHGTFGYGFISTSLAGATPISYQVATKGLASFEIEGDCSLHGSLTQVKARAAVDIGNLLEPNGRCEFAFQETPVTGTITSGEGGLPVLSLDANKNQAPHAGGCSGLLEEAAPYIPLLAEEGGWDFGRAAWRSRLIDQVPVEEMTGEVSSYVLRTSGQEYSEQGMGVDAWSYWYLKRDAEGMEIVSVLPQYRDLFLENVPEVMNEYRAIIDWSGETPQKVEYSLAGRTVTDASPGDTAVATFPIHELPAGKHKLTVIATAASGKTADYVLEVVIVSVPEWAKPFALKAHPVVEYVWYESMQKQDLVQSPLAAQVTIPPQPNLSLFAGPWAVKLDTLQVGILVDSILTDQKMPLSATGEFSVAGKTFPIVASTDSFVRAQLTADGLEFHGGNLDLTAPVPSFPITVHPLQDLPGSQSIGQAPPSSDLQLLVTGSAFTVLVTPTMTGSGKIALANDGLKLETLTATGNLSAATNSAVAVQGSATLDLKTELHGSLTLDLLAQAPPKECILSGMLFLLYTDKAIKGTFPPVPSPTIFKSCAEFGL